MFRINNRKFHYAWAICAAGTLQIIVTLGLGSTTFSVFLPYIIEKGGMTNTQGSLVGLVRFIAMLIGILAVNRYVDALGLRRAALAAMLGNVSGLLLYAFSDSFAGYCAAAAITNLCCALGGVIPVSILIRRWFTSHGGLAYGICTAGSGLATIIVPPVFAALVSGFSVTAAFLSMAAFSGVSTVVVYLLIRESPEQCGTLPLGGNAPSGASPDAEQPSAVPSTDLRAPLSRSTTVILVAAMMLSGAVCSGGISNLSMLYLLAGFDQAHISVLLSAAGLSLMLGKCFYGWLADRIGGFSSTMLLHFITVSALIMCCMADFSGELLSLIAVLALGFGLPLGTTGMQVLAGNLVSREDHPRMMKRMQLSYQIGATLFSPIPGILADITDSYVPAYRLLLLAGCGCALLTYVIYRRVSGTLRSSLAGAHGTV